MNYLPQPSSQNYDALVNDISSGNIKIPQFQRKFVWNKNQSANLLDSIIKGYPIGTFIFWKTREELRSVRNVGDLELPPPTPGNFVSYVLDGQQRLTSLYATLKGARIEREGSRIEDYSEMYINLEANYDDQIVVIETSDLDPTSCIKITDLLSGGISMLASYPQKYHTKLDEYKNRILSYSFSIVSVQDAPIDIATEIFTRINVGGKPLSLFEIMVAKTYDSELDFDLSVEFENLIDELGHINYETISESTTLQLVSIILNQSCKRSEILRIPRNKFIETWSDAKDAIIHAAEYFKSYFRIPVSQLLPYNTLMVPFAYFFYKNNLVKPIGDQALYMADYFWKVSLSGRFSSGVEVKLASDAKRINLIFENIMPEYDWTVDISLESIRTRGEFSAGNSYIKAILCMFTYYQPKSFVDNSLVNLSNSWLKQANSKNYHHFFPRAFLKRQNADEKKINHIANITIVDDFLNKRLIKDKAPSEYMKEFEGNNSNLSETMKSHLISDLEEFGVFEDNYDLFFEKRLALIAKELQSRMILKAVAEH